MNKRPYEAPPGANKADARAGEKRYLELGFKKRKRCTRCYHYACVCARIAESNNPKPRCLVCKELKDKCKCKVEVKQHFATHF